jgi:5-methylcytosine-specific restriction endonuclease McrA
MSPPDPKPRPRVIDPAAGLEKVWTEGRCRVCKGNTRLTRHHLVPRSQSGGDVDANLVPLCVSCHDEVEHHRSARAYLRRWLTREEWSYVVGKVGLERAQRRYP